MTDTEFKLVNSLYDFTYSKLKTKTNITKILDIKYNINNEYLYIEISHVANIMDGIPFYLKPFTSLVPFRKLYPIERISINLKDNSMICITKIQNDTILLLEQTIIVNGHGNIDSIIKSSLPPKVLDYARLKFLTKRISCIKQSLTDKYKISIDRLIEYLSEHGRLITKGELEEFMFVISNGLSLPITTSSDNGKDKLLRMPYNF